MRDAHSQRFGLWLNIETRTRAALHLEPTKLDKFRKLSNEELIDSLKPGTDGSLKTRPDGTVLEGNHRLKILSERGFDVDDLPREIVAKDSPTT